MYPGDPTVEDAIEEAKDLQRRNRESKVDFASQSSILEHCGENQLTGRCDTEPTDEKHLIKQLGLNSHQYLPLVPTRVYGRSDRVPFLNLTGPLKHHIAYSASNNIILFDYIKDQQIVLQGHKNKIVALVKDRRNKFFASGDWGPRSTVIIWDIFTGNPYQSLPLSEVHSNGVSSIDFAGYLTFIGVLGAEKHNKQIVSVWPYDSHRPVLEPVCQLQIPSKLGYQHEITFHPEKNEFFATTGHRGVAFYTWNRMDKKIMCHVPKLPKSFLSRMKKFTHSIWSVENGWLLTSTLAGFIVIWDVASPIGLVEPPDPNKNIREFKRCYKIGTTGLSSFAEHEGFYVVGDVTGVVRFYDKHFRLLRWTKNHKLPPIYCIAFNELKNQPPDFQRAMRDRYDTGQKPHIHKEKYSHIKDYTLGMAYYHQPSETTIERSSFDCPDFFLGVAHGNLYYYHLAEERLDTVVHGANSAFIACDVNQVSNHLALLTYKGEIHLYDTKTHRMIHRRRLFKKPTRVCCLKFHPTGAFAFVGALNGKIFYRRAFNWKPIDSPLDNSRSPISSIIFSEDGLYMAYHDKSRAVGLYINFPRKSTWVFKGKQRMHCKEIVDIMLYLDRTRNQNRLFSLSADRRIIEYDIPNSSLSGGLKALTVTRIEQFSIPRAMTLAEPFPNCKPHIIIANNNYKLSVYDPDDRLIRRTCQAPVYGTPVNKMMSIKPDGRKQGARVFTIFVCGNKLGLAKPPIDGNPYKYMALLSHPTGVKSTAASFDHKCVFSIGNSETVCIQWRTNVPAIERGTVSGGSGLKPFLKMLDRDMPEGKSLVTECQNCFYMLMLQKISSTKELLTSELRILVKEIPAVIRFCGYFPTEYEIDLMIEEAEFLGVLDHGERNDEITFDDFVKLFANHRRFPQFTKAMYANAFRKVSKHTHGDANMRGLRFRRLLTTKGEKISDIDLPVYLPNFFRSVIHTVYEPQIRDNKSGRKDKNMKKKKVTKKEIIDVIRGKVFMDTAYSRSVPWPMEWKHDVKAKGKMTAILAHLAKQRVITDNFPALGVITRMND
ncbi:unnamed protein product [Allacma fusca]|uniref:WD repeat-containing protein on Y chromosome n=1 Tax=Allacma fusca TaxID=39272 RepID=A0A8J2KR15_9HEXA|nr:unnamed protein product [Allacma fusca]